MSNSELNAESLLRLIGKNQPRIVSLIASATEMVYALGLGPFLVGRSHECDYPPPVESLPVCTRPRFDCSGNSREIDQLVKQSLRDALSVYEIFDDVLEALQPTHILTQTQCEVCAVSLQDVQRSIANRLVSRPQIVSLEPNCLADIWTDMRRIAESVGIDASPAIRGLQQRIEAIYASCSSDLPLPRIACIEWLEPLMAAGNWVPELVTLAGGINLFGKAGHHSSWMNWEQIVCSDPDVIVVMPCGFSINRTKDEMHWIEDRPDYASLKAVKLGRIFVADGNQFFNRPGPRVVESLQILAEIVHPETAGSDLEGLGYIRWQNESVSGAPRHMANQADQEQNDKHHEKNLRDSSRGGR